ncbi:DUF6233 domain-containing protein [Streptomyces sp. NPDC021100]
MIHHEACFSAPGPAELTTAQAIEALGRPGAENCSICRPEAVLGSPFD